MDKHHHGDLFWQVSFRAQFLPHFFFSSILYNDLPNGLKTTAELFANDSFLFAVVKDKNKSVNALNNDLSLISQWDFNWKMLFSHKLAPHKPAQEVL